MAIAKSLYLRQKARIPSSSSVVDPVVKINLAKHANLANKFTGHSNIEFIERMDTEKHLGGGGGGSERESGFGEEGELKVVKLNLMKFTNNFNLESPKQVDS